MTTLLQDLTLTGFATLKDVHVQVMFLSTTGNNHSLRKLALKHCPLLSNAAVHSISRYCTKLQELSLLGNVNIDSLDSLHQCWNVQQATSTTTTSLQSLFVPVSAPIVVKAGGTLLRLNIIQTSVTATNLVSSLKSAPGKVCLKELFMDGETWTDELLHEFANTIDERLENLDISCSNRYSGTANVKDDG